MSSSQFIPSYPSGSQQFSFIDNNKWTLLPRLPISPTMLIAYRAMHGNKDKGDHTYGPMHGALYLFPRRHPDEANLANLASWLKYAELTPGSWFFWDPTTQVIFTTPQPPNRFCDVPKEEKEAEIKVNVEGITTFAEYTAANPPNFKPKHYRGEQSFAHYGYTAVGNTWADPDSAAEVLDAHESSNAPLIPMLPVVSDGPKVMSAEEEDAFYAICVQELSADGEDAEGDPRQTRISPAIFAQWAQGASRGDRFVVTETEAPQPFIRRRTLEYTGPGRLSPWKNIEAQPQICQDTGDLMTGVYEPEQEPSVIFDPQEVDMNKMPETFSQSYPLDHREFRQKAFGMEELQERIERSERTEEWVASSTAPDRIRRFQVDTIAKELATSSDPDGEKHYEELIHLFESLKQEHDAKLTYNEEQYSKVVGPVGNESRLKREILILQNQAILHELSSGSRLTARPESPPPVGPETIKSRPEEKKNRFTRYVAECEQDMRIEIKRTELVNEELEEELAPVLKRVAGLEVMSNELKSLLRLSLDADPMQFLAYPERAHER